MSVIMAAYNRSNVLRHAVASALAQRFGGFELLVVGDACTDDTEAAVASFGDPRLRFVSLARNCGEQSGPNNEGLRLARGRLIAYLNQDDLWFPDHLGSCVDTIRRTGADWVYAPGFSLLPDDSVRMVGVHPGRTYSPYLAGAPLASQWLARKETIAALGGWRSFREVWGAPSLDLLARAWESGARIESTGMASVLMIHSGLRPGSYAARHDAEHVRYAGRIGTEPGLREELLFRALERDEAERRSLPGCARLLANAVLRRAARAIGVYPGTLWQILRYGRKKAWLNSIRRRRGLPRI